MSDMLRLQARLSAGPPHEVFHALTDGGGDEDVAGRACRACPCPRCGSGSGGRSIPQGDRANQVLLSADADRSLRFA